jgi:hypothetical protein
MGYQAASTMQIGEITILDFPITFVNDSTQLYSIRSDGIMGISYSSMLATIILAKYGSFSIKLKDAQGIGHFSIGDTANFIHRFPIVSHNYWSVMVNQIWYDNFPLLLNETTAIIDSGTSSIIGSVFDFMSVIPCGFHKELKFNIGGVNYSLLGNEYVFNCECMVESSSYTTALILGDTFLRKYFVKFTRDSIFIDIFS